MKVRVALGVLATAAVAFWLWPDGMPPSQKVPVPPKALRTCTLRKPLTCSFAREGDPDARGFVPLSLTILSRLPLEGANVEFQPTEGLELEGDPSGPYTLNAGLPLVVTLRCRAVGQNANLLARVTYTRGATKVGAVASFRLGGAPAPPPAVLYGEPFSDRDGNRVVPILGTVKGP